jgi:hypothetical protein
VLFVVDRLLESTMMPVRQSLRPFRQIEESEDKQTGRYQVAKLPYMNSFVKNTLPENVTMVNN